MERLAWLLTVKFDSCNIIRSYLLYHSAVCQV